MNTIKMIDNSFILVSKSDAKFDNALKHHIAPFISSKFIDWWQPHLCQEQLHCTLNFFYSRGEGPDQAKVTKLVSEILNNTAQSLHLRVAEVDITTKGWVILKFKEKQKLKKIHGQVLDILKEQCHLKPSKYSGDRYMPHVTVGRLKLGADRSQGLQEIRRLFEAIAKNPFPFVVYDFELKTVEQGRNHTLVAKKLARREIGVQKVVWVKRDGYTVFFDRFENAQKFAWKLFKYYNISGKNKKPKRPWKICTKDHAATIRLTKPEFKKVKWYFNNLR